MAAENLGRDGYVSNKTTKLTARLDITWSGDMKKEGFCCEVNLVN